MWRASRLPSSVQSAISTPAEASRTTGTDYSDLAELAGRRQVVRDPLAEPAWRWLADGLHPSPRIQLTVVVAPPRQEHHALRRVIEIDVSHES